MNTTRSDQSIPRLRMRGIGKSFGATRALDGVDLEVLPGRVHALVGENGAGKSTLMKILSGVLQPDAGEIEVDGDPFQPANPLEARQKGVAMIYQELALAPHLSVAANVVLGIEPADYGWLQSTRAEQLTTQALETLGHGNILPRTIVGELSIGVQQVVEIARALVIRAKIVVFDEPTSSLTQGDVGRLFDLIRKLCGEGVCVVYISHFLEEVERIADRFTILRDGRSVATGDMAGTSLKQIVEWMVGRKLNEMFPRVPHSIGEPILELDKLASTPAVRSASFRLRRGEILGIAGLIGAGRTEMLRAIFGLAPVREGRVRVAAFEGPATPAERLRHGVGLLSEDRKTEGLAAGLTVEDNLMLSRLEPYAWHGWLRRGALREAAVSWMDRLAVKATGPQASIASLSGGNQQKVQLARLLHHDCDVLLLDEPTRGIDVASKVQIYDWIGRLAASGKAVVFVSSYVPELLGVSDTVAVMSRGQLGATAPVDQWDEHSILLAATGAQN